jgi:hypothetical protein
LLASPELRRKLGAAGRRTVEEKYSAQVQAPRVFQIFTSVVQKKKADKKSLEAEKQEEQSYSI